MIKKTFYNLPQEKQNRIVAAVKQEFSRCSQEKASINRIIKEANISRGSFYQYFDDKVDLIEILVAEMFWNLTDCYKRLLKENDGNIFTVVLLLFDEILNSVAQEENGVFFKNILSSLKVNNELVYNYVEHRFSKENASQKIQSVIRDYTNPKYLNCQTFDEVIVASEIVHIVLQDAIIDVFVRQENRTTARSQLEKKLELLKNGLARP